MVSSSSTSPLSPSEPNAAHATERVARSKYTCTSCGGEARWSPAKQKLICAFCGTEAALPPEAETGAGLPNSDIIEHDLLEVLQRIDAAQHHWTRAQRMVKCQQCQAISIFDAAKQAKRCEFCGSSTIVDYDNADDSIRPESVLPIQISEPKARDLIHAWYGKLWWAPNKLKSKAQTDMTHGVYLPYWTFDAQTTARWQAEAGYYYYVTETYYENGQQRNRQTQRVRWEYAEGNLEHSFDDTLVCGSRGVHKALLRQIEPFPTTGSGSSALRPYDPAYVSGWTVERYQIDLSAAARNAREQMLADTQTLCSQQVPGDTQRNLHVDAQFSRQTFKHILAPVWLMIYIYGAKDYQVIINAVTGQIAGEYPKSWVKITLAVIAVLIMFVIIFGSQR